jgi:hypothetical protein
MNRKVHFAALFSLGLASVALGSVAFAQSSEQEEAQKRFQEGKALFDQKQFSAARVKFVQACAVVQTTNCPKNLALTEVELSMWVDAATHFQQWLDDPRTKNDPLRPDVEKVFADTKLRVGQLDFDVDAGARVSVDGKFIGLSPIAKSLFISSGDHDVEAVWPSQTKTTKQTVFNGKAVAIVLHKDAPRVETPDAGAAPPPSASATVTPPPSVTATTPPPSASASIAPPPSASATVAPPPSASASSAPPPDDGPPKSKGPAIAVGGILTAGGILGFIGFGAFAAGSNSSKEEADSFANTGVCVNPDAPRCLDYKSARDSQGTQHTLSIISLVSGLIFLAGGVSLIVFAATSGKKAAPVQVTPSVGAGSASLTIGGSF